MDVNDIKVSIMITCYNYESCIDSAIESVVKQNMPFKWELLVGDDGSSDNTVKKINKWIERFPDNIKLFIQKRGSEINKTGLRAARNRAFLLKQSTGDFLIFLDGDDCFLGTQKIQYQANKLLNNKYSKCSSCAHNILANVVLEKRKYNMVDESVPTSIFNLKEYWPAMYFHTNTILFRKECKSMLLDIRYRDYLNDNFITYILLQYGSILYINETWAQYNMTGDGLWTGKNQVYSCFRNMMLFDLELSINPKMKIVSFVRHLYHFRVIFKYYNGDKDNQIATLFEDVDKSEFPISFLLFKRTSLTLKERTTKIFLKFMVFLMLNYNRLCRLIQRMKIKLLRQNN